MKPATLTGRRPTCRGYRGEEIRQLFAAIAARLCGRTGLALGILTVARFALARFALARIALARIALARFAVAAEAPFATHAGAVAASLQAELRTVAAFVRQYALSLLELDLGQFQSDDLLDEIRLGLVKIGAEGADLENGNVVRIAGFFQFVQPFPQIEDGFLRENDAVLLQGDFVGGVFDFAGGLGLGILVKNGQLSATHRHFVFIAMKAADRMDQAIAGFDRTDGGIGEFQHAARDGEGHFLHVAEHDAQTTEIVPVLQANGEFRLDIYGVELGLPIHLRPEEAVFVKGTSHERLQLTVELQSLEIELRKFILEIAELLADGCAIEPVGHGEAGFAKLFDARVGLIDFVKRVGEIMLLRLEAGELVVRREGRGGCLVADRAGMERQQIAVEAVILSHALGIAFDDHLGPMAFELHHVGHGGVGGCVALGGGRVDELVSFRRGRQWLGHPFQRNLASQIRRRRFALASGIIAGRARRARDAAIGRGALASHAKRHERYKHNDSDKP